MIEAQFQCSIANLSASSACRQINVNTKPEAPASSVRDHLRQDKQITRPHSRRVEEINHVSEVLGVASKPLEDIQDKVIDFYQLDRIGKHPTSHFVQRKELEYIEKQLHSPKRGPVNSQILSLVGLGGAGKTQLMLQYAWTHRDQYGVVLWFDAQSIDTLDESFLLAASQLGLVLPPTAARASDSEHEVVRYKSRLESNIEAIRKELRRRRQQCLLLFDGADDIPIIDSLPQYFYYEKEGDIIVSSRRKEAYRLGRFYIEVGGLSVESACNLLLYHACLGKASPTQLSIAEEIVKNLDCIALAIDLAGS